MFWLCYLYFTLLFFQSSEATIAYNLFLARRASDISDMAKELDDIHRANADKKVSVDALEEIFLKAKEALLACQEDLLASSALAATLAVNLRAERDQYLQDASAEGRAEYLATYNSVPNLNSWT